MSSGTNIQMGNAHEADPLTPGNKENYNATATSKPKAKREAKPKTEPSDMTCGATPDFWWRIKMAFSMAVGVMISATPSLLLYAGVDMGPFTPPTWLDGYAPVITIFVCGYNMGETNEYNYQAIIGCVPAQLFVTAWVAVFGLKGSKVSLFLELTVFSGILLALPVANCLKKYGNGLNVWVAVAVAAGQQEVTFGWTLILWGMWGYFGALVANMLPPKLAIWELRHHLHRMDELTTITLDQYMKWMCDPPVAAGEEGEGGEMSKSHRMICCELQKELTLTMAKIETRHNSSFYEPRAPNVRHRTKLLMQLLYRLHSRLSSIQLCGAFQSGNLATMQGELKGQVTSIRIHLLHLFVEADLLLEQYTNQIVDDNAHTLVCDISELNKRLSELQDSMAAMEKADAVDGSFDNSASAAIELFVGCISSYAHELADFKDMYNMKGETDPSRTWCNIMVVKPAKEMMNITPANMKMSLKVTLSVLIAAVIGVYRYNYDSSAAITICYVVGGHIGGSFDTTIQRVLGVVFGAVFPITLLQLTSTEWYSMTIIMALFVFAANYVRCAGGKNSYAGSVASFVVVEVLLMNKNGGTVTHTESGDFQMVEQCCMGVVIFVVVELLVFPKHGPEMLREKIQDGLSKTFELQKLQFDFAMKNNGSEEGFKGVEDINAHTMMLQSGSDRNATYIDTDSTQKSQQLLVDMHEKLVADAGIIAAMDADYVASLKEPEVCRRVFGAECYASVKDSVTAMHRCLQVMNIMYDDKLEYKVDQTDKNKALQDESALHRAEIMREIKPSLDKLQKAISDIVNLPGTGILEILKDEKASGAGLDKDVVTALIGFEAAYDASRTNLLNRINKENLSVGLSAIDRLRLAAWYVSLRNISDHMISIYRELTYYYWDRQIGKTTDDLTIEKIDQMAGEDNELDEKEYLSMKVGVTAPFYFVPSGTRYS